MIEICKKLQIWYDDRNYKGKHLYCTGCIHHTSRFERKGMLCDYYDLCLSHAIDFRKDCENCPAQFYCWTQE